DGHVAANQDVEVNALGIKNLRGFTFSGAGGFVGLSAGVSVWTIGQQIQKHYQDNQGGDQDATVGSGGPTGAGDDAAGQSQTTRDAIATRLGQFDGSPDPDSNQGRLKATADGASSRLSSAGPSQTDISDSINNPPRPAGTSA